MYFSSVRSLPIERAHVGGARANVKYKIKHN